MTRPPTRLLLLRLAVCAAAWCLAARVPAQGIEPVSWPAEEYLFVSDGAADEVVPRTAGPIGQRTAPPRPNAEPADWTNSSPCCGTGCCDDWCALPGRFWARANYQVSWGKGAHLPPLVTSGPDAGQPGLLGSSTTTVLFGDAAVNDRAQPGGQVQLGYWLDGCQNWGLQGDYSGFSARTHFVADSFSGPVVSRPFIDVTNGANNATPAVELVSLPGTVTGFVTADAATNFQTAGLQMRRGLCCRTLCDCDAARCCDAWVSDCQPDFHRLDAVAGPRFYRLDDSVTVQEQLIAMSNTGVVPAGTMFVVTDSFKTTNEFTGGEVGLVSDLAHGRWSLELQSKVALGNNHEVLRINGSTIVTVPNVGTAVNVGGLLATNSIGTYSRDEFVAIPQLGLNLGYQWACRWRTVVGYNFIYWAHVSRAGDQINLAVNQNQLPPNTVAGANPPVIRDTNFWAQGINIGLEFRF